MKLFPTHLNLVIAGLSFMADITKSYIECLWMHCYCKQSMFDYFNKMLPVNYSVYLSNIVARVHSKLTAKSEQVKESRADQNQKVKKWISDGLMYIPKSTNWRGIDALEESSKIDRLMELISDFEVRLIRLYELMIKNKIKSVLFQTEAIDVVKLRNKIEGLFKDLQHLRSKTYRVDLAYTYFKKHLMFSKDKIPKLLPLDHHIVINSELLSQRSVVLLKVNLNSTSITFANTNALELFEVGSFEEFSAYQIQQFMPSAIAKVHDSYIVDLPLTRKSFSTLALRENSA